MPNWFSMHILYILQSCNFQSIKIQKKTKKNSTCLSYINTAMKIILLTQRQNMAPLLSYSLSDPYWSDTRGSTDQPCPSRTPGKTQHSTRMGHVHAHRHTLFELISGIPIISKMLVLSSACPLTYQFQKQINIYDDSQLT